MGPEILSVTRYDSMGTELKSFKCYAGHISVLRARNERVLQPYIQALSAELDTKRFDIKIDQAPYSAANQTLCGFGESLSNVSETVLSYLSRHCSTEGEALDLLEKAELSALANQACSGMSRSECSRLMICAITAADPKGIIVFNEPFKHIPERLLNFFGERIANFAWKKKALVLVVNLSKRPDSWIDNQLVSRIQVDETIRRKTVGFGAANSELTDVINQVREEQKKVKQQQVARQLVQTSRSRPRQPRLTTASTKRPSLPKKKFTLHKKIPQSWIAGGVVAFAAFGFLVGTFNSEDSGVPVTTQPSAQNPTMPNPVVTPSTNIAPAPDSTQLAALAPESNPSNVMDLYPLEIRKAIEQAYRGEIKLNAGARKKPKPVKVIHQPPPSSYNEQSVIRSSTPERIFSGNSDRPKKKKKEEILKALLARAKARQEQSSDVDDSEKTDADRRREAIRKRFIDAIRRSVDKDRDGYDE